jgi:glutamate--cysteine ligase
MSENPQSNYPFDLIAPFRSGIKPKEDFKIGLELELFPVNRSDFKIIPFHGEKGIEEFLKGILQQSPTKWTPQYEGKTLLGLSSSSGAITLEPGSAFEYSISPLPSLAQVKEVVRDFFEELKPIAENFNLNFLALGYHPFQSIDEVELIPKRRYQLMYEYMPQVGSLGREMMKLTSSLQVAIDFYSEEDAMRKMRVANLLSPTLVALSANSFIKQKKYLGMASYRGKIWEDTDRKRCGLAPFVFKSKSTFLDYAEWALDIPMYFIERSGVKHSAFEITFRQFLDEGFLLPDGKKINANEKDWDTHLSTLFPWVRLRNFIELRQFDVNNLDLNLSIVAFIKALFYSDKGLTELEKVSLEYFNSPELFQSSMAGSITAGLDGKVGDASLRIIAEKLVEVAKDELSAVEAMFLAPLVDKIKTWNLESIGKQANSSFESYISRQLIY